MAAAHGPPIEGLGADTPVEGVAPRTLNLPITEIFYRFTFHRDWDVSEMSMGKYVSMVSRDDAGMRAAGVRLACLPAFDVLRRIRQRRRTAAGSGGKAHRRSRMGPDRLRPWPRALRYGIERLMPEYQAAEEAYFRDTRIHPIVHALVVKGSVPEYHP